MEYSRLCFMLLSLSGTGISGYFVVVTPSPTAEVVSSQNLSITCQWSADYTGPYAAVNYRLNDGDGKIGVVLINFGTCIPSTTPAYTLTCNKDTRTLGIQILANSYSHGDRWTCEGRNDNFDGTTPPQTDMTTVDVRDETGLSGISGYFVVVDPSPTAEVVSSQNLSITCQWSADYTGPNAAVNYRLNEGAGYIGTLYINFGTACPSTSPYTITCNRDTRTLGIHIPANSYSHGDRWTCEGRNDYSDGTTPPQTNTTTVDVKDVTGLSVVIIPSPTAEVVSGQNLSITCQWSAYYTGPNAAVNYKLNDDRSTIGGVLINFGTSCKDLSNTPPYILTCNKGTRTLGIQIPATSYSHGDRWTCEGRNNSFDNTSPTQRDTTTVYVEVPVTSVTITPSTTVTVDEGTSTTLTCTTQPHSRPTASVTWYRVVSGQPQQITANISVSHDTQNSAQTTTSVLSYVPSKEDNGRTVYCVSDGGWTGSTDTTLESGRVSLNVRYRPAISIAPQDNPYVITEGQTGISLVCNVTSANPGATSIVWTREATEVSNTGVYNLATITTGRSGEYTCSATNDVGTTSESITLVVISSPAEPNIVGITNVSSSSLTVKWSPNDESSKPSTFNVTYRCKRCEVPDTTSIVRIPNKGVYSTTFNNLLPETLYYVNITAINQVGSSNPLDLIVSTQAEETCFSSLKCSNTSSTALIVVGAILIFISFTVLGFSIFLYRKSRLPSRPVDQQEETPKSVVFSSVLRSEKESDQMPAEENKSHYQELDPSDIQPPSAYECLSRDDDAAIMKYERDNYESLQGDSVKRDYEQLHVDDESKHYLNT